MMYFETSVSSDYLCNVEKSVNLYMYGYCNNETMCPLAPALYML